MKVRTERKHWPSNQLRRVKVGANPMRVMASSVGAMLTKNGCGTLRRSGRIGGDDPAEFASSTYSLSDAVYAADPPPDATVRGASPLSSMVLAVSRITLPLRALCILTSQAYADENELAERS
jgi:hypothetical protein